MKNTKKKLFALFMATMIILAGIPFPAYAASVTIPLVVTASSTTVPIGQEVTITVSMGNATNMGPFSFDISLPDGLTYKQGSGLIDAAFRTTTGMASVDFEETLLSVSGYGGTGYTGLGLNIATFVCTATKTGNMTVSLTNLDFSEAPPNYSPITTPVTDVLVVVNPAPDDNADITAAKAVVEGAFPVTVAQTEIANEASALTKINEIIGNLTLNNVTPTVTKISYTEAITGTASNVSGTNGSYCFTVNMNKGIGTQQTTNILTLNITATTYSVGATIPLTITSSSTTVTIGQEVTFTISMGTATNMGPFSFDITLPDGLSYKQGTGSIDAAFRSLTGMASVDFEETPLSVSGYGGTGYTGSGLIIATLTCTATKAGNMTVTLTNTDFSEAPPSYNPIATPVTDVMVLVLPDKILTAYTSHTAVTLTTNENITTLADLKASGKLPTIVQVTDGTTPATASITDWTGTFDGTVTGAKTLTAVWDAPLGYTKGSTPITITITVNVDVEQTMLPKVITGHTSLTVVTLTTNENITALADIKASGKLPSTVQVTDGTTPATASITDWTGSFDGTVTGVKTLTAVWDAPIGYTKGSTPIAITITVSVNVAQTLPDKVITSHTSLTVVTLTTNENITTLADIKASGKLPATVQVTDGTTLTTANITDWTGTFDGTISGAKTLTAAWDTPLGYTKGATPITITITVNVNMAQTMLPKVISGHTSLTAVTLATNENITALADIKASGKLPSTVQVTDGTTPATASITDWTGSFDGTVTGVKTLTAVWDAPLNYTKGATPITITITVNVNVVQTLPPKVITGHTSLTAVTLTTNENITTLADIKASGKLPTTVQVTDGTTLTTANITDWTGTFDGTVSGAKTLTAVWNTPLGYTKGATPITITITVNVNVAQTLPPKVITGHTSLTAVTLTTNENIITLADIKASGKLPTIVQVTDSTTPATANITDWTGTFDGTVTGAKTLTAVWDAPLDYTKGATPITITITVNVNVEQTLPPKVITGHTSLTAITLTTNENITTLADLKASGKLPNTVQITDGTTPATASITDWTGTFDGTVLGAQTLTVVWDAPLGYTKGATPIIIAITVNVNVEQTQIPDTTPPVLSSVYPTNGATGVAISGNLSFTFNEPMDALTPGTIQLDSLTALTGGSWSVGDTVFTISYSGLSNRTLYTINVFGFKDVTGNAMVVNSSYSFTTTSGGGGGGGGGGASGASTTPTRADFDKSDGKDIVVSLTTAGYTFKDLRNGSYTLVKDTDYTVNGNRITINESYLATLTVGEQVITFAMSGGSNPTLTLSVKEDEQTTEQIISNPEVQLQATDVPLTAGPFPFTDVEASDWYYDDVIYIYSNSLMNGTENDKFSPNTTVTRGMVITVLYRQYGSPVVSFLPNPFGDVPEDMYYTAAVKWGADNGIILGNGNGNFSPDDTVTREQLAAIMYRYQDYTGKVPTSILPTKDFSDDNSISAYAKEAVYTLFMQRIISGRPGDIFDPHGYATRAEFASILHRYLTSK